VYSFLKIVHIRGNGGMKMDFQIRQAIRANVQEETASGFEDIINDAIERGDEHLLPGLGVFLEAWWQQADANSRHQFASNLENAFHH